MVYAFFDEVKKGRWHSDKIRVSDFTNHVNSVIKSCFANLRDLHCICRFLSNDVSVIIANALVSSHLDYCNSLSHSLLLKQDVVNQKRCFSKFLSTALQFINPKVISASVSHVMLQNFGMIFHWKLVLFLHYQVSKGDLKLICFRSLSLPRSLVQSWLVGKMVQSYLFVSIACRGLLQIVC